jgi:hypothetical protein
MLPPFDQNGNLPPGVHRCTAEELIERYGKGSPEREIESRELLRFIDWARQNGVRRLLINGSFITSKPEPNDVDLVILPNPNGPVPGDEELLWPFLHILIASDDADWRAWATVDFATDRNQNPKGVVEVIL